MSTGEVAHFSFVKRPKANFPGYFVNANNRCFQDMIDVREEVVFGFKLCLRENSFQISHYCFAVPMPFPGNRSNIVI